MTTGNLDVMSVIHTMQKKNKPINYKISDYMPIKYQDNYNFDYNSITEACKLRREAIKEGMFAFVSWKWINPFAEWIGKRKCLEVMAGRGILSYALKQKEINIIATDDYSWFDKELIKWRDTVIEVIKLDAVDSVKQYGKDIDILIMSWPYMDDVAYNVIKELYKINPEAVVVYIGEGCGGCTGNDEFYEHFQEIKDDLFEEVVNNFEQWRGIHDRPMLGRYFEERVY